MQPRERIRNRLLLLANFARERQATQGLTPERIEIFENFTADESLVGEQRIVCLGGLRIDMEMVRLDNDISHYFCKSCTDTWFKGHNKCSICNHVFY